MPSGRNQAPVHTGNPSGRPLPGFGRLWPAVRYHPQYTQWNLQSSELRQNTEPDVGKVLRLLCTAYREYSAGRVALPHSDTGAALCYTVSARFHSDICRGRTLPYYADHEDWPQMVLLRNQWWFPGWGSDGTGHLYSQGLPHRTENHT